MAHTHTKTEDTARGALQTLIDNTHVSVVQVQGVLGLKSRQGVYDKLSGKTKLNLKDIDRLTAYFQIPPFVLFTSLRRYVSGWRWTRGTRGPCSRHRPAG